MRYVLLTAIVLLVGCAPAAGPTVQPPTNLPTSGATGTPSASSTQTPAPVASSSSQPAASPTEGTESSPPAAEGLAGLLATLTPVLASFNPAPATVTPGEEVISRLEDALEMVPDILKESVQAEIDRYTENELLERGSITLGTEPGATLIVDRFASDAGAAADFPEREASCDDVAVPGDALDEVVIKRCNAPGANSIYLIAQRSDLVTTLQVTDLPEDVPIDPVVSMLADIFRTIESSLAT